MRCVEHHKPIVLVDHEAQVAFCEDCIKEYMSHMMTNDPDGFRRLFDECLDELVEEGTALTTPCVICGEDMFVHVNHGMPDNPMCKKHKN